MSLVLIPSPKPDTRYLNEGHPMADRLRVAYNLTPWSHESQKGRLGSFELVQEFPEKRALRGENVGADPVFEPNDLGWTAIFQGTLPIAQTIIECGDWDVSNATTQLTVAALVRWDEFFGAPQFVQNSVLFGKSNNYGSGEFKWILANYQAGINNIKTFFGLGTTGGVSQALGDAVILDNDWHLVCGTWDGSTILYYFDGVLDAAPVALSGSITPAAWKVRIGGGPFNATNYSLHHGAIAACWLWERALDQGEILELGRDPWVLFRPSRRFPGYAPPEPTVITLETAEGEWEAQIPEAAAAAVLAPLPGLADWEGQIPDIEAALTTELERAEATFQAEILNAEGVVGLEPLPALADYEAQEPGLEASLGVDIYPGEAEWEAQEPDVTAALSVPLEPTEALWEGQLLEISEAALLSLAPAVADWLGVEPGAEVGAVTLGLLPAGADWQAELPDILTGIFLSILPAEAEWEGQLVDLDAPAALVLLPGQAEYLGELLDILAEEPAFLALKPALADWEAELLSIFREGAFSILPALAYVSPGTNRLVGFRMADKKRIHDKLVEVAMAAPSFYPVTFDPETREMLVEGVGIEPASVAANETESSFNPARNLRTNTRRRDAWTWDLHLDFDREVTCEDFEDFLSNNPIRLDPDPVLGLRRLFLNLISTRYQHPPRHEPAGGTQATFTFEVDYGPT